MGEVLEVTPQVRLVPFQDANYLEQAFQWYQDPDLVHLVDGVDRPYTWSVLTSMYHFLDQHGELFWIEAFHKGDWIVIGDVTFSRDDLPIVIGDPAFRHQGIGRQVLAYLIEVARSRGWQELTVREIYDDNLVSRRCFESLGFRPTKKTAKGTAFHLTL